MPIPRLQDWSGPAVLSYGFRPFFLLGAFWAACSVLLWVVAYIGGFSFGNFANLDWHIHEMIFGFAAAIIGGFLLTSIPNWTGRLPVQGWPLAVLVVLWLAGRVVMLMPTLLGVWPTALIDMSFLVALALAAGIEIVAGRNWRNLKTVLVLGALVLANAGFHMEIALYGQADIAWRAGLSAVLVLIMIVGGRIIPSFTRNWLARNQASPLPVPFNRGDVASILVAVGAFALWSVLPLHWLTGVVMLLAGLMQIWRLSRWAGLGAWREPLVLVLHVAFAFLPFGMLLVAATVFLPDFIYPAAAVHAFAAGALGVMTLAVMTRASLGHTGRKLRAGFGTCAIYVFVVLGALVRVAAATQWAGDMSHMLLGVATVFWVLGFGLFVAVYGPALLQKRIN